MAIGTRIDNEQVSRGVLAPISADGHGLGKVSAVRAETSVGENRSLAIDAKNIPVVDVRTLRADDDISAAVAAELGRVGLRTERFSENADREPAGSIGGALYARGEPAARIGRAQHPNASGAIRPRAEPNYSKSTRCVRNADHSTACRR